MALQQVHNVQQISSYNGSRTRSKQAFDFRQAINTINLTNFKNALTKPLVSKEEAKAKHSKAESCRRRRINKQYGILRTILPNLVKMNKASVLEETIRHVKELRNVISEHEAANRGGRLECVFPGLTDKLRISSCEGEGEGRGVVKVMLSCEDKGKLMTGVGGAVRLVKGKVEKAEMVTMGGRTKCVLWVKGINGSERLHMLRKAVNDVMKKEKVNTSRICNSTPLMN